jgi:peptidoglycan hydrolase CwlO-like protein
MLPPKSLLIPGPWTAKGNTIKDGYGKTIAYVVSRNSVAHAYWFAHLPEFIAGFDESQAIAEFQKDVDTLRDQIKDLKNQLAIAKDQIEDATDERERVESELALAIEEIAELKGLIKSPEHI